MRYLSGIIFFALLIVSGCAWKYVYQVPNNQDEVHYCRTEDGWDLAVFHYKPPVINPEYDPVILLHGLSNNAYFWDIDRKLSFADYLRNMGYDVWSVSLRGSGKSTKPGVGTISKLTVIDLPVVEERYTYNPGQIDWNIDDHINKDMPAVVKYIKEKTGKDKVNLIGHSMGAMIICGYIEKFTGKAVNSFVAVGMPMMFPQPANELLNQIENNKDLLRATVFLNVKFPAQIGAPLAGSLDSPSDLISFNKSNMDPGIISKYYSNVIEDIYPGVVNQFLTVVSAGQFVSADNKYNYTANMPKIDVPVLFVGGKLDNLASPASLCYSYSNIGSKDKTLRIFGRQDMYKSDYGHVDLILGKNAPQEVYPFISRWLNGHSLFASGRAKRVLTNKKIQDYFTDEPQRN